MKKPDVGHLGSQDEKSTRDVTHDDDDYDYDYDDGGTDVAIPACLINACTLCPSKHVYIHLVREQNCPQELALELLQQSWQLALEVNTMTYNAAISACEMLGKRQSSMQCECFVHCRNGFYVDTNVHSQLFITVDASKHAV